MSKPAPATVGAHHVCARVRPLTLGVGNGGRGLELTEWAQWPLRPYRKPSFSATAKACCKQLAVAGRSALSHAEMADCPSHFEFSPGGASGGAMDDLGRRDGSLPAPVGEADGNEGPQADPAERVAHHFGPPLLKSFSAKRSASANRPSFHATHDSNAIAIPEVGKAGPDEFRSGAPSLSRRQHRAGANEPRPGR